MLSSRASSVASLPPIRRPNHASRFEGIPKTKLQASSASDPETLQSQVTKTARKRLSLRGLEVLHGRLSNIGNEEDATARAGQRTRDRLEATAIAIAFDHRSALDGHGHARERLPIGCDGTEINREDATGLCRIGSGARYFGWPQFGFVHRHGQNLWPAEMPPSRPSGAKARSALARDRTRHRLTACRPLSHAPASDYTLSGI